MHTHVHVCIHVHVCTCTCLCNNRSASLLWQGKVITVLTAGGAANTNVDVFMHCSEGDKISGGKLVRKSGLKKTLIQDNYIAAALIWPTQICWFSPHNVWNYGTWTVRVNFHLVRCTVYLLRPSYGIPEPSGTLQNRYAGLLFLVDARAR